MRYEGEMLVMDPKECGDRFSYFDAQMLLLGVALVLYNELVEVEVEVKIYVVLTYCICWSESSA